MIRRLPRPVLPGLTLAALLASLAVAAPAINTIAPPARAVFAHLPLEAAEPTVTLAARRGADGAWRVELATTDFAFTEVCLTTAEAAPVGHAHVILNGKKVASAFTPLVTLGELPPGRHHLRVVLRAQDHRALVGRDGLIQTEMVIDVPVEQTPRS